MEQPDFLYHYTSIESLAMILSTKKLRFTALNEVDDLNEGKNQDFEYMGKYFFVSCWSSLKEESLPFWHMYSRGMTGVRIKMPSDVFNSYDVSTKEIPGIVEADYQSIVPEQEIITPDYWVVPSNNKFLHKITYTDDQEKLLPKINTIEGLTRNVNFGRIGRYKIENWSFQSEWRHILIILPSFRKVVASNSEGRQEVLDSIDVTLEAIEQGVPLPISYFYVNINQSKFEQMEILLGPKHTESDKLIVESLIQRFNPSATLSISSLHKKVR